MTAAPPAAHRAGEVPSPPPPPLQRALQTLCRAAVAAAAAGVLAMAAVTCADILLRQLGHPLAGAYDLVRVAGGLTLAFALPVTTALKGHVAIEYFFLKLRRRGRLVVDALMRLLQIAAFAVAARECARHGLKLLRSGEVLPTLQWPVFWVAWVIAAGCALACLVTLHQLIRPGRELLRK